MWRAILLSKPHVKNFGIIKNSSSSLINITLKNFETASIRPFKNELKYTNINQFNRKLVTDGSKINSTSLKDPLNQNNSNRPKSKIDFEQMKKFLAVFVSGCVAYIGISYALGLKDTNKKSNKAFNNAINYSSQNLPGKVKVSKSIRREKNPGNVKITLYQIVTCPFCCKVRAYLDYFGYSYDIVEVNSLTKAQLDWSDYKKSPIIVMQIPSKENPNEYEEVVEQLNDSSVIISALETFRLDQASSPIKQIKSYYEPLIIDNDDEKNKSREYINKYFVMLYHEKLISSKNPQERKEERQWRKWVDDKFIHVISPNVYRTIKETTAAFDWYDKVGDWESQFSKFERFTMYYAGVIVMYLLSIYLKRKYELKPDVRESLYDLCNEWMASLSDEKPFQGGTTPNIADLNLYGVISSFEGTETFNDMMKNTKIKSWYDLCKEDVDFNNGRFILNNPIKARPKEYNDVDTKQTTEKKKKFFIF